MRTVVFAVCILAAVTVGDAQLIYIMEALTSKIFDAKELIEFHLMFAECAMKLGLLKIASPELSYCIAQKKNLIDEDGGILWDKSVNYIKTLIRDANQWDEIDELFIKKCKEKYDKFEGSGFEKSLKAMECGLPMVRYIIRQKMIL